MSKKYRDKNWLYQKYWNEGLTTKEMGELCGVNQGTILLWMRKCNIIRRTNVEVHTNRCKKTLGINPLYKNEEWLRNKHLINYVSVNEIAEECGVLYTVICRWMNKYKIPKRKFNFVHVNKIELEQLYIVENKTIKETARILGVSEPIISKRLKYYNIPNRRDKLEILDNKNFLVKEYVKKQKSASKIAREIGCRYGSVLRRLRKHNIKIRRQKVYNIDKEYLLQKYEKEKLSTYQIGEKLGCSRETVCRYMKKYELRRRTYKEIMDSDLHPFKGKKHSKKSLKKMRDVKLDIRNSNFDFDFFWENDCKYTRSSYPYNEKFNKEFKQKIRELYDNKCVITGMTNEEHKRKYGSSLIVHHWMYNKDETNPFYFVPVTKSINGQANKNKMQWVDLFNRIAEEKYCELLKKNECNE